MEELHGQTNTQDAAPAGDVAAAVPAPVQVRKKNNVNNPYIWGTGRRKTSVARVRIKPGNGKFEVNGRDVDAFFCVERDRESVRQPLRLTGTERQYDVFVNVRGGGTTGQAGAVLLGLARALVTAQPQALGTLRSHNMLTRDSREVERKKYGRAGARRSFQFSKR